MHNSYYVTHFTALCPALPSSQSPCLTLLPITLPSPLPNHPALPSSQSPCLALFPITLPCPLPNHPALPSSLSPCLTLLPIILSCPLPNHPALPSSLSPCRIIMPLFHCTLATLTLNILIPDIAKSRTAKSDIDYQEIMVSHACHCLALLIVCLQINYAKPINLLLANLGDICSLCKSCSEFVYLYYIICD